MKTCSLFVLYLRPGFPEHASGAYFREPCERQGNDRNMQIPICMRETSQPYPYPISKARVSTELLTQQAGRISLLQ